MANETEGYIIAKESEEVYTLMLTTYQYGSNPSTIPVYREDASGNLTDVYWNVDYDDIFKGRQKHFEHCRVRFNMIQGPTNAYTYDAVTGYLGANFASKYNNQRTSNCSTVLGLIYPQSNPNVGEALSKCVIPSTLNEIGVDINIDALTGKQLLNLRWITDDTGLALKGMLVILDWEIMLSFTLYNS